MRQIIGSRPLIATQSRGSFAKLPVGDMFLPGASPELRLTPGVPFPWVPLLPPARLWIQGAVCARSDTKCRRWLLQRRRISAGYSSLPNIRVESPAENASFLRPGRDTRASPPSKSTGATPAAAVAVASGGRRPLPILGD